MYKRQALTIASPVAVIGEFMSVIMRIIIAQFSHVADRAIEEENYKKAQNIHIWWSFGLNCVVYFVPIFLTIYFGTDLVDTMVNAIPEVITNGLTDVYKRQSYEDSEDEEEVYEYEVQPQKEEAPEPNGQWMQNEKGWWFAPLDGTYPADSWYECSSNGFKAWYYFNAEGYMNSGWFTDRDGRCV